MQYLPFHFQELLFLRLNTAISECSQGDIHRENIIIEKCRTMAASWSVLTVFLFRWLFYSDSFLIMSRKEDLVDQAGNMNCLFEKLRFMLRRLPEFLLPKGFDWRKHSKKMLLINPNGGEISGEATTESTGRSGRVNAILYDELAFVDIGIDFQAWGAASQTTLCRIAVSTPNGPHNLFCKLATDEEWEEDREVITMPWYIHPVYAQGLEVVGGKFTSPWYRETKRTTDAQTFAKDIEISYKASTKGTIYEQYNDQHVDDELKPIKGLPIIVSIDPGTHWFTGFFQIDEDMRMLCLREYYSENAKGGIDQIIEEIQRVIAVNYMEFDLEFCGDPAGANINSAMHKGKSEYQYLLEGPGWLVHYDFMYRYIPKEWEKTRILAVQQRMTRMSGLGPSFLINSKLCPRIHGALAGNYRWETDDAGNVIEGKAERVHPWADAADVTGYVPLYRKMYMQNVRKPVRAGKRQVIWGDPSGGKPWAS